MSFLRNVALQFSAVAQKESVAQCAASLQLELGRHDAANTTIKSNQWDFFLQAMTDRTLELRKRNGGSRMTEIVLNFDTRMVGWEQGDLSFFLDKWR